MPCYHPLPAWNGRQRTEAGKRSITFRFNEAWTDHQVEVPCGNCIGCRLKRAQEWATRCYHETKSHSQSIFATLTYDDEHLPTGNTLQPEHLQQFWKRLRYHYQLPLRYFACGEYGDTTDRAHYHAIIFGIRPTDGRQLHTAPGRDSLFHSATLTRIWGHGHTTYGEATQQSAGYVARYTLGKIEPDGTAKDFQGRVPPFLVMSRNPGIGAKHLDEHHEYITRFDGIRQRGGHLTPIPRYYEDRIAKTDPRRIKRLKTRRQERARANAENNTGQRLIVRETVAKARQANQHRE